MSVKFVEWLERQLIRNNMLAIDLAQKLRMSRQSISAYRHGRHIPRYTTVIALCSVLGDDPERVWRMIKEATYGDS